MAYATYSDIEKDFKDLKFSSTSNVTINDVKQFIVEADALIDGYVGTVYSVPLSDSAGGYQLLKLLSRSLVAARVKKILEVVREQSGGKDAVQSVIGVLLSPSKVMEILRDIQKKEIALAGATSLVSGGGFYSKNVSEDVQPTIEKDTKQW